ncbi:unnamed protein product, partial [Rotaria sp. Silwood2]
MGFINMTAHVSATCDLIFINKIFTINENTSGEECLTIYKQYQDRIEKLCSERICTLASYYSSSVDLFEFIHSLKTDDVYNMQEAVNDWDDTLRETLNNTSFNLDDVVTSFDDVWKNSQFSDLLKCLESSSLELSTIKRVYLELTDKEKSKRGRIEKILKHSLMYFVRIDGHRTNFDIY